MKTIKKISILFFLLLAFSFTGCYTVVWSPDTPMPQSQTDYDSYYQSPYFGDYYNYYDNPWWYSVVRSERVQKGSTYQRDKNGGMINLRNDNGRNGGEVSTGLSAPPRSSTATVEQPSNTSGSSISNRTESVGSGNSSGSSSGNNRGSSSNSSSRSSNNDRNSNGRH